MTATEPRVLVISVTARGRALAQRLPYAHHHGDLAATVRRRWKELDALVLMVATGAAVRIVGPLLKDKREDPAVVCVDEAGRFAVSLCGGHAGGANDLAREVAALIGAEPIVTTATDATGRTSLDDALWETSLDAEAFGSTLTARGDIAEVTAALLDGRPVTIENPLCWPLPSSLARPGQTQPEGDGGDPATPSTRACRVLVTDRSAVPEPHLVVLHPPSLIVGLGSSSEVSAAEVRELVERAVRGAGLAAAAVAEVATIHRRANFPAFTALGLPIRSFAADVLAEIRVPNPSAVVAAAVGTPSVAEAAALAAGGPGAELVVSKQASAAATVAIARRTGPRGRLSIVGLGPGAAGARTPDATSAIRHAEVVAGYAPYVELCRDAIPAGAEIVEWPIGAEVDRARHALTVAAAGTRVVLVCSGDAGIYGMASLVFEAAVDFPGLDPCADITVVPGITASSATSAVLGAPLGHDHVTISLSDLLTPWAIIERRISAAADADLVVAIYNPRSRGRDWQLGRALDILGGARSPDTPVGIVTDAGRPGERLTLTRLDAVDLAGVTMTSCVIVGSSATHVFGGRMVTPRGYRT